MLGPILASSGEGGGHPGGTKIYTRIQGNSQAIQSDQITYVSVFLKQDIFFILFCILSKWIQKKKGTMDSITAFNQDIKKAMVCRKVSVRYF